MPGLRARGNLPLEHVLVIDQAQPQLVQVLGKVRVVQ